MGYVREKTRGAVFVEQVMIALAFLAGSALLMTGWLWGGMSFGGRIGPWMFMVACALGVGAVYVVLSAIRDYVREGPDRGGTE